MARARPTPGPWWVEDRRLTHPDSGIKSGGEGLLIMGTPRGEGSSFCVASVNNWGGGNEADAELLARAPELLEDEMAGPRITEETLRALAAIAHFGEATTTQIRTKSGLASGSLSPILARLEASGWLASREAKAAGKQAAKIYRINDEAAVRDASKRLMLMLEDLLEAVS